MGGRDRRKHPRLEGHFKVDLLNMGDDPTVSPWEAVVPAEALDVSMQGMRVKATYDVKVGTYLSVLIYYKGHESICLCETLWKREVMGETVYGLFFKEWSKLDKDLEKRFNTMAGDEIETPDNTAFTVPGPSHHLILQSNPAF